jgi:3-dehydroquinate synthetase
VEYLKELFKRENKIIIISDEILKKLYEKMFEELSNEKDKVKILIIESGEENKK